MEIRDSVMKFARLMEEKLRENDHKGGWIWVDDKGREERCDPYWLFERLGEEKSELERALGFLLKYPSQSNRKWAGREAADVANFAMMIADVCDALDSEGQP